MDGGFDCDRGRGRGSPRGTPNRSGGRQFMGSGAQSHRRHDPQHRVYSRGRREKVQPVYVAKNQEGQNSSEAVTGVSEVYSVIASDLPHNGNNPPLTSPLGSSLSTGEKTQIGETSKEQQRVYSRGRREKVQPVYVAKNQVGQNSSEAVTGVSEVYSVIASDLPHNGNSPPLTSPLGSSLSTGEEKTQIGETSKEQQRVYSRGRREKVQPVYVAKNQEGQNSSEAVTGVSEVYSVIASDLPHNGNSPPLTSPLGSSLSTGEEKTQIGETSKEVKYDDVTLTSDFPNKEEISQQNENCLSLKHGDEDVPLSIKSSKTPASDRKSENSENSAVFEPFDICPPKTSAVKLKPSLLVTNRERRNETKCTTEGLNSRILRRGMVLLKSYISISDQIKIVKQCRHLGLGPGGFYQPGYRDGAKLHLNMMCLGKNWDPQTSKYGDCRPTDGAKPPPIPIEFNELVKKAIQDSHFLIRKESEAGNAEEILPWMTPDICLVNFYSTNGRLGLHQDRDESRDNIRNGLPVVSFSIGDAADFMYSDRRDVDTAEKVKLESGDVLIFGGEAREVFHGVTTIHTNTAPKTLLEETDLRPGRVNLTFRQY